MRPYATAMTRSRQRIGQWNPADPNDLVHHLRRQSAAHRTFVIRDLATPAAADGGIVGTVNVSNVVQGRFLSATMGYNAFDPYAGTGMFREGLALVVGIVLRPAPAGMGLHRLEANVRVENARSAGVLRCLGFRRERTVRRMLWLADGLDGPSAWRDHDSYAVTADEWPAEPYADHGIGRGIIVFDETVSQPNVVAIARELGLTALVGVGFEAALGVARNGTCGLLWHAGSDAPRALESLAQAGLSASDGSVIAARIQPDARSVTRAALTLRPLVG